MKRTLSLLLMLVVATGCGRYSMPNRDISDRLSPNQVEGVWQMTQESVDVLQAAGLNDESTRVYSIDLRGNRSCDFESVIDFGSEPYFVSAASCS